MESIFTELQKREKDFEERMKALDKELVSPLLNEVWGTYQAKISA